MTRSPTEPGRSSWSLGAVVGLFLSLGLLTALLLHLDLNAVAQAVARAHVGPLAVGALVYCALFPLRGLRWALLLRPLAPVSPALATRGFLVGFMANNLLPARLGDVVRALVLARAARVPRSATFATVLLEKVFDGVVVVGILGLALAVVPVSEDRTAPLRAVGALMGLVFGGALIACTLLAAVEGLTLALAERALRPLPERVRGAGFGLLTKLASGLHVLRHPGRTAAILALSVTIWVLEVVVYIFVAQALGQTLPVSGLALVMSVLTLGLTAPSAPGFVGVFEALVIPALGLLEVGVEAAAAFALVLHAIHYLPGTLLGWLAAWMSGWGLSDLASSAAREEDGGAAGAASVEV